MKKPQRTVFGKMGEKTYLSPPENTDAPLLQRWINDHEVTTYLTARRPLGITAEENWIASANTTLDKINLMIVSKDDDAPIGNIVLRLSDPIHRHAELGIMIGEKSYYHRGHATEAMRIIIDYGFKRLGLNKIALNVHSGNDNARALYLKVGFVHEGTLRQEIWFEDGFKDVHMMSVLREEFYK